MSEIKVHVVSDSAEDKGKSFRGEKIKTSNEYKKYRKKKRSHHRSSSSTVVNVVSDSKEDEGKTFAGEKIQTNQEYDSHLAKIRSSKINSREKSYRQEQISSNVVKSSNNQSDEVSNKNNIYNRFKQNLNSNNGSSLQQKWKSLTQKNQVKEKKSFTNPKDIVFVGAKNQREKERDEKLNEVSWRAPAYAIKDFFVNGLGGGATKLWQFGKEKLQNHNDFIANNPNYNQVVNNEQTPTTELTQNFQNYKTKDTQIQKKINNDRDINTLTNTALFAAGGMGAGAIAPKLTSLAFSALTADSIVTAVKNPTGQNVGNAIMMSSGLGIGKLMKLRSTPRIKKVYGATDSVILDSAANSKGVGVQASKGKINVDYETGLFKKKSHTVEFETTSLLEKESRAQGKSDSRNQFDTKNPISREYNPADLIKGNLEIKGLGQTKKVKVETIQQGTTSVSKVGKEVFETKQTETINLNKDKYVKSETINLKTGQKTKTISRDINSNKNTQLSDELFAQGSKSESVTNFEPNLKIKKKKVIDAEVTSNKNPSKQLDQQKSQVVNQKVIPKESVHVFEDGSFGIILDVVKKGTSKGSRNSRGGQSQILKEMEMNPNPTKAQNINHELQKINNPNLTNKSNLKSKGNINIETPNPSKILNKMLANAHSAQVKPFLNIDQQLNKMNQDIKRAQKNPFKSDNDIFSGLNQQTVKAQNKKPAHDNVQDELLKINLDLGTSHKNGGVKLKSTIPKGQTPPPSIPQFPNKPPVIPTMSFGSNSNFQKKINQMNKRQQELGYAGSLTGLVQGKTTTKSLKKLTGMEVRPILHKSLRGKR